MNPITNTKNQNKLNQRELELGVTGSKSSWHGQYKNSAYVFIGGLNYDLTEGDIISVFSQYGEIVDINLVRDKKTGKSKGFCFLCYEDQRSTILATDNLNGIKLVGRIIRVDHTSEYRRPKDDEDVDEVTARLRSEGCAPAAMVNLDQQNNISDDVELLLPLEDKQDDKKSKSIAKKKKKKKKRRRSSSESSSSSEDNNDRQARHRGRTSIKQEVKQEDDHRAATARRRPRSRSPSPRERSSPRQKSSRQRSRSPRRKSSTQRSRSPDRRSRSPKQRPARRKSRSPNRHSPRRRSRSRSPRRRH